VKINIVKQEGKYMEMEFSGEGHTLLNLLQDSLLEDKNVEMAGYSKPHPLMDRSTLFIRLKRGARHLEAVKKAVAKADGKLDEFLDKFEKSLAETSS
jgi:DNA-directed RNA polymerase subunit L